MEFITKEYTTRRGSYEKYVRGYIDTETHYVQKLCIEYRLYGIILIWRTVYHQEEIPAAMIQYNTLGSTDWVSPHKNIINEHIRLVNEQKKR